MRLNQKTVVVGVCGGIAAYKTCELVSLLVKEGAKVHVVMTENATKFVAPLTFETLSHNRVVFDMFNRDFPWEVEHISLAKAADAFVIAPMTANVAGKLACGIADDFLTTTVMAATCKIIVAPAMNTNMLMSQAYVSNAETLRRRGVLFAESGSGRLACGDEGKGRMAEPSEILDAVVAALHAKQDFAGKILLLTAGATSEPIDPVRYITNRSSGKMGCAIANAAAARGANVIMVCGNMTAVPAAGIECVKVQTTQQMCDAVMQNLERADAVIKAAAPADYRVKSFAQQKIKAERLILQLSKNPDIAKLIGQNKGDKKLVIFCAETENLAERAKEKLQSKNADIVVANDVTLEGAGFDTDTNIASIITAAEQIDLPLMKKTELAEKILDKLAEII